MQPTLLASPNQKEHNLIKVATMEDGGGYAPLTAEKVFLKSSPAPEGLYPTGEELVCVYNELRIQLVSALFSVLGDYEDAQDAAQDAFLKCWRNREGIGGVRNLRAWIYRIGLNAAKDLQRNAWRRRARPLIGSATLVETHDGCPVKSAEDREAEGRLRRAMQDLRPKERKIFLLRQNTGLTYEEIAKLLRTPVGTVKTQMRAAVAKLRQLLREESRRSYQSLER